MRLQGMLRHIAGVGAFTALSRVLGLVREMLQSRLIGAGVEQSAFTLAFAIPNMARKLFGEGALTSAFVPIFKGMVDRGETDAAKRLARAVMTTVILLLGSIVVIVVGGLSAWLGWFGGDLGPRAELTIRLVRILFPYMVFICGAAFGMGVLNAIGRFAEGAFMPAMLNIVWIVTLGILCFFPGMEVSTRAIVVCWAILAGGAAQMAFLFRCMARRGYHPRFSLSGIWNANCRLVWKNTAIAAVGAGAVQINQMLDQVLAQCAAPWAAGVVGYAERLMDLPLGVIGVAFGTVLLPTFAGFFAQGNEDGARQALRSSLVNLMFVMVPASAGLLVLAPEVTSVVYEGRAFDSLATLRVSRALAVYALGLGLFGYQKSLIPWFQAQNDMKTPLRVSVQMVLLNAVLNVLSVIFLPEEWRHVGLAASTDICAAGGCVLLTFYARHKNGDLGLAVILPQMVKIVAISAVMAAVLWLIRPQAAAFGRILCLTIEIAAGATVYGLLSLLLKSRLHLG